MHKIKSRLLSFSLCFFMVFGIIADIPISAGATEASGKSISENSMVEISAETTNAEMSTSGNTTDNATDAVYFYDNDETTLLFSFPTQEIDNFDIDDVGMISPVRKGYALYKWFSVYKSKAYLPENVLTMLNLKKNTVFHAVWETEPYTFSINYQLNDGFFPEDCDIANSFTVLSDTITLSQPQRKGYVFDGWYIDAAYTTAITSIPTGTYIDSDANGNIAPYTVYAKWTSKMPGNVSKPTAVNSAKGKIKVTFPATENAEGYEITFATNKKLTKDVLTKDIGNKTTYSITNLPKGKKYSLKVRAYTTDSTGEKCYGKYSPVVSCKVKKGVKEYVAKKNSGKLQKVMVTDSNTLYVQAKVSKRLKSSDGFYYLVKVDPNTGKILKQIAKTDKTKTVKFTLPLKDAKGNNHIQGKFGVAVKKGKKYMLISGTSYINNPEDAASYTAPFPTPTSKKGRQGCYNSDLGDKNYFVNFCLNKIIASKSSHDVAYKYNGKTYYFYNPHFGDLSTVNKDGGTVTVQVMLQWSDAAKDLILKSGRVRPVPGRESITYYAFNTDTKAGREKLEAAFQFLAEYASEENYHVDNWIVGNEVNTYANPNAKWFYAGNISRDKFIKNYASTYRMMYYAVKSNNKNGRVYICCDHTWINREQDWGTRYFTSAFHKEIKSQNKNIKWNLAYHAYSAVLTNADFWNDGRLAPNSLNADFVSPNNLEILTDYVKDNFGSDVRIILSEQGFSCSGGVGSPYNVGRQTGEGVQAAAVAYLYYKAQFNDMIDAVIFSSGDHGGAGYQFDFIGRQAEATYKYMDTPQYEAYTGMHLSTIKQTSWAKAVKNFSDSKLKSMPNR